MKLVSKTEWDEYYGKVYGYFYRRVEDKFEVEELTANTLNDFLLSNTNPENPNAYLWAIAKNKLFSYIKNKNKQTIFQLEDFDTVESNYSAHYFEKIEALKKCIDSQLKAEEKTLVELLILDDFSSQQAATKLEISPGNVRIKLHRALNKLRENCKKIWLEN